MLYNVVFRCATLRLCLVLSKHAVCHTPNGRPNNTNGRLKLFEDSIGGVDGGLKSGDVSAKLVCDVDGCDAVAAYGSPFDGVQRRCRRHRGSEGDITCHVGLTFYALDMLGDSIVVCAPRHTHRLDSAAQLYAYYTRQAAATGHPLPLAALNRFFQACASRKQLPDAAIPLMEVVTSKATDLLPMHSFECARAPKRPTSLSVRTTLRWRLDYR